VPKVVGRANELLRLSGQLTVDHLAVVTGPPGVGKTTLAAAFVRQLPERARIFWHNFHKDEGSDVLISKLAAFLARHQQVDLWRMLHSRGSTSTHLPPEVLGEYLFQHLPGQGHLLCIDDLHYADDGHVRQLIDRLLELAQVGELSLILVSRHTPRFISAGSSPPLVGLHADDRVRCWQDKWYTWTTIWSTR
jgi:ATP/maltotriose-dependent transcriptional regulator MalT